MATHAIERRSVPRLADSVDAVSELRAWSARYSRVHADLGTGDGTYALSLARRSPSTAIIAVDANLDHLRGARRRDPANLRFVTANALGWQIGSLPPADTVTINFPYGSLLRGLVDGDRALVTRLDALLAPTGTIEVRINASALVARALAVPTTPDAIAVTLRRLGGGIRVEIRELGPAALRAFPSTWAKRLGYGRATTAWHLIARRCHVVSGT